MENKKLVSVTVPSRFKDKSDFETFTAGNTYSINSVHDKISFDVIDNYGDLRFCLFENCSHIDDLDWILNYE